jgi:hypothetical protein
MATAMSPGFSRVLALALLALLLAALWRFAAMPAWDQWRADGEAIAATRDAIARFKGVAAARESLSRQLARVRSNPSLEGALMRAATVTLAAAQLQQQLKSTVEERGGSVVSSQALDGEAVGPFVKVKINVRMTLTMPQLQRVLYRLESQRPVLVVDELLVLSRQRRRRRNATDSAGDLDVRALLSGYMPGEPRKPAGGVEDQARAGQGRSR